MRNYLKWELKDYFNSKSKMLIGIAVIYLLTLIIQDFDGFLPGLVLLAFVLILIISVFFSFIMGTKKIIDTYRNKTFLLESMIPLPVEKILLSKYILGIIINLIYYLVGVIGISIITIKLGSMEELIKEYTDFFTNIDVVMFIRFIIFYFLSIICFMSFMVSAYLIVKVINPNGKVGKFTGFIAWVITSYTYAWIILEVIGITNDTEIVIDLFYLISSLGLFFLNKWIIENKLEIYN